MAADNHGGQEGEIKILQSKVLQKGAGGKAPKETSRYILLGVLVLVFVFLLAQLILTGGGGKKKKIPRPQTAAAQAAVGGPMSSMVGGESTGGTPVIESLTFPEIQKKLGRSPFAMKARKKEAAVIQTGQALILQGIMLDADGSSYAIINENIVKKGDHVADKTVVEIQKGRVILQSDSGEATVLTTA